MNMQEDELIKLNVDYDEQNSVRDAETAIKIYFDKLKKSWPNNSDKNILAMVAFEFAKSYHQSIKIKDQALDIINNNISRINELSNPESLDIMEIES